VNTGEDLEITSKAAAKCVLFLARKTHGSNLLDGFRFAVLGLGDSNHLAASHRSISWASGKDCNQCGELFDRWLDQLGGTRLVRRGESDLRTDHDAFAPWMSGLWASLATSE
jgi:sulfite reductase alpha subunit-like flavoprotein